MLRPGDLAIYDCRRPYTMDFGEPQDMSFLMFPCDRLRLPPAAVDQVLATPVSSADSTGSLVAAKGPGHPFPGPSVSVADWDACHVS